MTTTNKRRKEANKKLKTNTSFPVGSIENSRAGRKVKSQTAVRAQASFR